MINSLLTKAIDEVQNLKSGEVFLVKDLFKGYEWNRLAIKNRLKLGILFLNEVNSKDLGITVLTKTSSNQQKYQKL